MLELPGVSVLTEFGSGVSPDPASVSTGQLLATLPGGLGNWLPMPAGLPTDPRVPFPCLPHIVCIPQPSPHCAFSHFLYPPPHCAFPQLRTLLRIVCYPMYPPPPLWCLLMSLFPFPFPALCDYPNSPLPLAALPFPCCVYPLP